MTKNELKNRIVRVKGLVLKDPWGTPARVDKMDLAADTVWLCYDGIDVPFERPLDLMVDAANGLFLADRTDQFVKHLAFDAGVTVTFHYEPHWSQSERPVERVVGTSIEALAAEKAKLKKGKKR